mmetsp:Transcript_6204/g.16561  ORF Transcript_6204/g.16561 Transcript_6204/m.16561 type:complete len:899 (-) Transcript_6204:1663-4359(-)
MAAMPIATALRTAAAAAKEVTAVATVMATAAAAAAAVVEAVAKDGSVVETAEISATGAASLSARGLGDVALRIGPAAAVALKELSLASNAIVSVDLSALAQCTALEALLLNSNALEEVDLAPLVGCTQLQKLWLHKNRLRSTKLAPLSKCTELRSLYLDDNKLDEADAIELGPLADCTSLRSLRLGGNKLGGKLDVSALRNCSSLAMMDVAANVKLHVVSDATASHKPLPPALRRRSAQIDWVKPVPSDAGAHSPAMTVSTGSECSRRTCFLMGFERHSLDAFNALFSSSMKVLIPDRMANGQNGHSANSRVIQRLLESDVIVADAHSASEALAASAASAKAIPVVLVVRQPHHSRDAVASAEYSSGGEFAAVLFAPLDANSARIVAEIAEESTKQHQAASSSESREESAANAQQKNRLPGSMTIDFGELRTQAHRARWVLNPLDAAERQRVEHCRAGTSALKTNLLPKGRFNTEESALRLWLRRFDGLENDEQWKSLTSLVGLPSCASGFLHRAVITSADCGAADIVTGEQILAFWTRWMKAACRDLRLFEVLAMSVGTTDYGRIPEETVCELLLAEKVLLDRAPKYQRHVGVNGLDLVRRGMVFAVQRMLMMNCGGHVSTQVTAERFVKSRVCEALHDIESGAGAPVLRWLRANQLEELCSEFDRCARSSSGVSVPLEHSTLTNKSGFQEFCILRRLIVPEAAAMVYDRLFFERRRALHCGAQPKIVSNIAFFSHSAPEAEVVAFGCFYMACQDITSPLYADYWFNLLDSDDDGVVNILDLSLWWNVKVWFMRDEQRDGIPSLEWLCTWLRDAVCGSRQDKAFGTAWSDFYLTLKAFRSMTDNDRGYILRALLFCDDEIETLSQSAEAVVPGAAKTEMAKLDHFSWHDGVSAGVLG